MTKAKYIVIEGPEGAGKTTQVNMLAETMRKNGLTVRVLREPDSQSDITARAIRRLTQDPQYPMNTRTEVLLYNAARSQSLEGIREAREQGIYCLVDRNYLTTLAVQYYGNGDIPDYDNINTIIKFAVNDMEPDLTIVLDADVPTLKKRVKNRYQGERFDNLDEAFLERVRSGYLWEAKQRGFPVVYATESPEAVFKKVWKHANRVINQRRTKLSAALESVGHILASKQMVPRPENGVKVNEATPAEPKELGKVFNDEPVTEELVTKDENNVFSMTKAGEQWLAGAVSTVDGDVYAFTDKLSPVTIAAAMARLSRRGDDMRITILDEFAAGLDKDAKLLQRVITAYGDDSVQQLAGQHIVVENASNLLTKKLEWGRLAAYLEQSTRYIYFDRKDKEGQYKYYTPEYLDEATKKRYWKDMDKIFDLYSELVHKLTDYIQQTSSVPKAEQDGPWRAATRAQACDAARPVLPVATKSTVGIFASGQALESLIMHLLSDPLPESHTVGRDILRESRKVISAFLERVDINERGVAMQGYKAFTYETVKELSGDLRQTYGEPTGPVHLSDYWPKNELDIVPDILYEHSHLSLEEIRQKVAKWPYKKKEKVFLAYIGERFNRRHRPGRAFEKIHYSWDLVCDYGIFRDLQRHRIVDDLEWQELTPRLGYDIPELVEEAGLSDLFEQCFDISLALYSALQEAKYPLEAQYATLLGHKMRWKVTYNAREAFHLHELRTSPQGHPGYRKLVQHMHEKLAEVHPLIAESMRFVNQDEDPELTRLAAERYSQKKLEQLK